MTLTGSAGQGVGAADGSIQPTAAAGAAAMPGPGEGAHMSGLHHPALQPLDIPVSPAGHLPPHFFSPLTTAQSSAGAHLLSLISPKGTSQAPPTSTQAPAQSAQHSMQHAMPGLAAIWNQPSQAPGPSMLQTSSQDLQQQHSHSHSTPSGLELELDLPRLPSNPWCLPSPDSIETMKGHLSVFASGRQSTGNHGGSSEPYASSQPAGLGANPHGAAGMRPPGFESQMGDNGMGGLFNGAGAYFGEYGAAQQLPGSWPQEAQHGRHQHPARPPQHPSPHEPLSWQQQQLLHQQPTPAQREQGHAHDPHHRHPHHPPHHAPPNHASPQRQGQPHLTWQQQQQHQQQQQQWQAWQQQQQQAPPPPPSLAWQQLGAAGLGGLGAPHQAQGTLPMTADSLAAALGALSSTGEVASLQQAELLLRMARGQGQTISGLPPPPPPPPPLGMPGAAAAAQHQHQALQQALLALQLQQLQLHAEQQAGALLAAQGATPPRRNSFGTPPLDASPMRGRMGVGMPHGSPSGLHDLGPRDGRRLGQQGVGRQRSPMPRRLSASSGPPPCRASLAALDEQLVALASRLEPGPEERQRHQDTLDRVRAALATEWPEARVHLFGSAANELCVAGATDIDVTLELPGAEDNEAKSAIVQRLAELFTEAGMVDVQAIPRARVPVCKAREPVTSTRFDVTVNNMLALVNTKLLRDYAALDPRLRQLVFLVKQWAKLRGVNDSYRGTLSSYAYVLLCIHLLQRRSPPILPVLQHVGAQPMPPPPPPPPGHHSSGSSTIGTEDMAAAAAAAASAAVAAAAASAASSAASAAAAAAAATAALSGVGSDGGGVQLPGSASPPAGSDKDAAASAPAGALLLPPPPPPPHPSSARHSFDGQHAALPPPPPPPPHHRRGPSGDVPPALLASLGLPPPPPPPPGRRRSSHQGEPSQDPAAALPMPPGATPQQTLHTFSRQVGPWHCEFYDDIAALKGVGAANQESLAELLVAFFDYWAWRHDYNGSVVSIRVPGGLLSKASKNWTMRQGSERHLVCIEDPFELSHDLGRTIDKISVVGLRREFERAARLFANEENPLPQLFTPI